jgi:hypothetical protein
VVLSEIGWFRHLFGIPTIGLAILPVGDQRFFSLAFEDEDLGEETETARRGGKIAKEVSD